MDDILKKPWWDQVIGGKPDTEQTDYQRNMKVREDKDNNNCTIMINQPERIDWIFEATLGKEPEPFPPTLGSMSNTTLEPFVKIAKDWFDKCPPTNRLAFGAILIKQTDNVHTGCEEILPYLPRVELDPQTTADFVYKINRPKKSLVEPSVTINRLNTWSVEGISNVGVTISSGKPGVSTHVRNLHVCKLVLDINTALLDNPISGDKAWEIFQELIEQGNKIASEGDV